MYDAVAPPRWATIDAIALSGVLRNAGCGELPLLIRPEPVYLNASEQRLADARAWAELRRLCWVDRRGQIDSNVLDRLYLLGRPPIGYGAVFDTEGDHHRLVVIGAGNDALLACREGPMISLTLLRNEFLPETLLRQLPDVPPAAAPSANVRLSEIRRADPFALESRTVGHLVRRSLLGAGELYVSVRDGYGRHKVSTPIRYQDYDIGRVLVVLSDGYLSVAPASKELLLARLYEARRSLGVR